MKMCAPIWSIGIPSIIKPNEFSKLAMLFALLYNTSLAFRLSEPIAHGNVLLLSVFTLHRTRQMFLYI